MINSKRIIATIAIIILLMISSMTMLVSCVVDEDIQPVANEVSIYMGAEDIDGAYPYVISTDKLPEGANVADMINATPSLNIEIMDSDFGSYVVSIGNLVPDPSYQFIAVYTTDTTVDVSDEIIPITHDGKTFYSSNVGIDGINVNKGESYAFILMDFGVAPDVKPIAKKVSIYKGDDNLDESKPLEISTEGENVDDMINATPSLYADMQDSDLGAYLVGIGNLVPDPSYQFIAVYTTDTTIDVSDEITPITHDGKTFYSSNVGVGEIPVKMGESYAFIMMDFGVAPEDIISTPIEDDGSIDKLVGAINTDITPTVSNAENINTLSRSGVKFTDAFYTELTASLVSAIALFDPNAGGMNYDRGHVLYTTSALLYANKEIPVKAIEYINSGMWIDDAIAEWTCGVMLPVINELSNAGYDMSAVEEIALKELMDSTVDGRFAMKWDVDAGAVAVIAVLPYYDRPEVKAVVDKTLREIESRMEYDHVGNICATAYVLSLAVECDYYGVETTLATDAMYTWILSHQDETGGLGYAFENIQSLRALSSYQINKQGNGTFFSYIK